jgi:acetoin utilization protein AcuB
MRIQDVMRRKVETIPAALPAEAAVEHMRNKRIRHLVVQRDGELAGVLSDRDVLALAPGEALRVEDVMSTPVVSATAGMTLRRAANLLRGRSIGCLPVLDEGRLVGIVTTSDLLERIGRGSERPVARGPRWILKGRGPRRKSVVGRKGVAAR